MTAEYIEFLNYREYLFHIFFFIISMMFVLPPSFLAKKIFYKLNKKGSKNEH